MKTLAVDIGGTKFTLAAFQDGRMLARESRLTDRGRGPEGMLPAMEEIIQTWQTKTGFVPDRCGIGFGGPVDFPSQTVTLSTHVGGWERFPLIDALRRIAGGAPAIMDNDANAGALGEALYGAGRGHDPLFYITLSTGIGGGLAVGGSIYRGADSFAGEIGHLNVDPNGPECLCGSNGCLERMCCGLWLERDCAKSAKELMLDPDFVRRYVVFLARGLKAAIMLLNPGRIVIGGGIAKAGPRLFDPLREELNRQLTPWSRARRDVVPAELGDDSVLYGALALAGTIADGTC
ncbi:MAG TPA: ROK family protein [Bryobacteraceae bacterium]